MADKNNDPPAASSDAEASAPSLPEDTGSSTAVEEATVAAAMERTEILQAMMKDGEEQPTPDSEGEKLVGSGKATDLANAMFGANSLVARRQAMLASRGKNAGGPQAAGGAADPVKKEVHKFWDTQPVKKMHEEVVDEFGPIDELKTPEEVRQTPYGLPKGFEWVTMNVMDPAQIQQIYKLLTENYVQDDDAMFRFDYSVPFLQWALTPPGYFQDWHIGVRQISNGRLRGFISGIPAEVQVYTSAMRMSEINFLCVHQKLRAKRLAPVLIKEVTRRVNLRDQWQAVYTAGVVLPKPVAKCSYWHRSLNPKKLVDIGFSRLGPRMTMSRLQKLYKLPNKPQIHGFRPLVAEDMPQVHKLLAKYLTKFKLHIKFTEKELEHWILPRTGVVDSFVVERGGTITDFCSYYHLPSSILKHPKHTKLNAVYSFYNVATSVPLEKLMTDCLIMARINKRDVFNCLDLMENAEFLTELKFGIGDGKLQYYLYNWVCPQMDSGGVGIVLL